MKSCRICKEVKPFTEFYANGKQPVSGNPKYHAICISCTFIVRKDMKDRKMVLVEQRLGKSCYKCGYDRCFAALDFHHVNPEEKEYEPAVLLACMYSLEKFEKEIEKCVLLCSNCHRELHAGLWSIN